MIPLAKVLPRNGIWYRDANNKIQGDRYMEDKKGGEIVGRCLLENRKEKIDQELEPNVK
uniref:Uncharacterized protein n=1 Tax=Monodelphis domestica TaxID=13616 RepID=A0A5F8GQY2_MONDO